MQKKLACALLAGFALLDNDELDGALRAGV